MINRLSLALAGALLVTASAQAQSIHNRVAAEAAQILVRCEKPACRCSA